MALALGDRVAATALARDRSHASDLFPAVERLEGELGGLVLANELDAVYVGIGPGSYTGLRVGIACAQGLARATGARLVGVPSFDLIAFDVLTQGERGAIVSDARAGSFYLAAYERESEDVRVLTAPCIVPHGELGSRLPPELTLFGDERARLEASRCNRRAPTSDLPPALALSLLRLGAQRSSAQAPEDVEPLYLRAFGK